MAGAARCGGGHHVGSGFADRRGEVRGLLSGSVGGAGGMSAHHNREAFEKAAAVRAMVDALRRDHPRLQREYKAVKAKFGLQGPSDLMRLSEEGDTPRHLNNILGEQIDTANQIFVLASRRQSRAPPRRPGGRDDTAARVHSLGALGMEVWLAEQRGEGSAASAAGAVLMHKLRQLAAELAPGGAAARPGPERQQRPRGGPRAQEACDAEQTRSELERERAAALRLSNEAAEERARALAAQLQAADRERAEQRAATAAAEAREADLQQALRRAEAARRSAEREAESLRAQLRGQTERAQQLDTVMRSARDTAQADIERRERSEDSLRAKLAEETAKNRALSRRLREEAAAAERLRQALRAAEAAAEDSRAAGTLELAAERRRAAEAEAARLVALAQAAEAAGSDGADRAQGFTAQLSAEPPVQEEKGPRLARPPARSARLGQRPAVRCRPCSAPPGKTRVGRAAEQGERRPLGAEDMRGDAGGDPADAERGTHVHLSDSDATNADADIEQGGVSADCDRKCDSDVAQPGGNCNDDPPLDHQESAPPPERSPRAQAALTVLPDSPRTRGSTIPPDSPRTRGAEVPVDSPRAQGAQQVDEAAAGGEAQQASGGGTKVVIQETPYRLMEALGKGGQGTVYKAVTTEGKFCAIKVEQRCSQPAAEALRQQVAWSVGFRHPNVVFTEAFQEAHSGPATWMLTVMELGAPLLPALRQQEELAMHLKYTISAGVAAGVGYLHDHGLVHGDVDAGNVVLVKGVPKLMDFGTLLQAGRDIGGPVGKYETAAPERIRAWLEPSDAPASYAWDVFALGLLCHCVFARGVMPGWPSGRFHLFVLADEEVAKVRKDPKQFLEEHCGGDPAVLESKLAEEKLRAIIKQLVDWASCPDKHRQSHQPSKIIPAEVAALVTQCWTFHPHDRLTAREFVDELRRIARIAAPTAGDSAEGIATDGPAPQSAGP